MPSHCAEASEIPLCRGVRQGPHAMPVAIHVFASLHLGITVHYSIALDRSSCSVHIHIDYVDVGAIWGLFDITISSICQPGLYFTFLGLETYVAAGACKGAMRPANDRLCIL
jgi:hypothetical protein